MAIHKNLSVNGIPATYWVIWDYSWNMINNQTKVTVAAYMNEELFKQYPTNCLIRHDYTFDGQFVGFAEIEKRMTQPIMTNRFLPDVYETRDVLGNIITPFIEAHNEQYDANVLTDGKLDSEILEQASPIVKVVGKAKSSQTKRVTRKKKAV